MKNEFSSRSWHQETVEDIITEMNSKEYSKLNKILIRIMPALKSCHVLLIGRGK